MFARWAPAVAKLEVVEPFSSAPRSVGTAFFVDGYGDGMLISNYHVVRDVIFDAEARLRLHVAGRGVTEDVEVLGLDAAHDIAVLRTSMASTARLPLRLGTPPAMGSRLFSLGHPGDLATSVIEGTYNGRVGHSVSPRYHFTGSVNPGMSGGPTITADGGVVGVNVSTAGNQMSFIIPSILADAMLVETGLVYGDAAGDLGARLGRRLEIFQRNFFSAFIGRTLPAIPLGRAMVPVGPEDSFDCGAEPYESEDGRYRQVTYRCTTFDRIAWPDGAVTAFISMEHIYLESNALNRFQFSRLYSDVFALATTWELPENDETGDWKCRRGNVSASSATMVRASFCARAHHKMSGLYDAFIRTALLGGEGGVGVVGTFRVNGATFDHAVQLFRRVMEGYAWND